jgi:hypothetical protein
MKVSHSPQGAFMRRLVFFWCVVFLSACNLTLNSATTPSSEAQVAVAWVENGNLLVWQNTDTLPRRVASGGVVRPYVSPDGQIVAFTRGNNGVPESLWTVEMSGVGERELVGSDPRERTYSAGENQIGDVQWWDNAVLYFNTFRAEQPSFAPRNDLYRANVRTREVALLLLPNEGGRFAFSPDKQHIAVVRDGTYNRQDGAIVLIDPLAQQSAVPLLFYVGVATGSHVPFYPSLCWSADSTQVYTVVPDADLIYSDSQSAEEVPLTRLWRLPIDAPSERELIGTVSASFFGLPSYNHDCTRLLYLQRVPESNRFMLMSADNALGENASMITEQQVDKLSFPTWLPFSNQFAYSVNQLGEVYVADNQQAPQRLLNNTTLQVLFLTETHYLVALPNDNGYDLWLIDRDAERQLIGTSPVLPIWSGVWIENAEEPQEG